MPRNRLALILLPAVFAFSPFAVFGQDPVESWDRYRTQSRGLGTQEVERSIQKEASAEGLPGMFLDQVERLSDLRSISPKVSPPKSPTVRSLSDEPLGKAAITVLTDHGATPKQISEFTKAPQIQAWLKTGQGDEAIYRLTTQLTSNKTTDGGIKIKAEIVLTEIKNLADYPSVVSLVKKNGGMNAIAQMANAQYTPDQIKILLDDPAMKVLSSAPMGAACIGVLVRTFQPETIKALVNSPDVKDLIVHREGAAALKAFAFNNYSPTDIKNLLSSANVLQWDHGILSNKAGMLERLAFVGSAVEIKNLIANNKFREYADWDGGRNLITRMADSKYNPAQIQAVLNAPPTYKLLMEQAFGPQTLGKLIDRERPAAGVIELLTDPGVNQFLAQTGGISGFSSMVSKLPDSAIKSLVNDPGVQKIASQWDGAAEIGQLVKNLVTVRGSKSAVDDVKSIANSLHVHDFIEFKSEEFGPRTTSLFVLATRFTPFELESLLAEPVVKRLVETELPARTEKNLDALADHGATAEQIIDVLNDNFLFEFVANGGGAAAGHLATQGLGANQMKVFLSQPEVAHLTNKTYGPDFLKNMLTALSPEGAQRQTNAYGPRALGDLLDSGLSLNATRGLLTDVGVSQMIDQERGVSILSQLCSAKSIPPEQIKTLANDPGITSVMKAGGGRAVLHLLGNDLTPPQVMELANDPPVQDLMKNPDFADLMPSKRWINSQPAADYKALARNNQFKELIATPAGKTAIANLNQAYASPSDMLKLMQIPNVANKAADTRGAEELLRSIR